MSDRIAAQVNERHRWPPSDTKKAGWRRQPAFFQKKGNPALSVWLYVL
jgi:hypothetical protein